MGGQGIAPLSAFFGVDNEGPAGATATALGSNGQQSNMPDVVGNVRIDQAWGSAQISAAWHNVGAGYYGQGPGTIGAAFGNFNTASQFNEAQGHPGNKSGWAVSPGVRINTPMIGPGDYFQAAYVYSEGATRYASLTPAGGGFMTYVNGSRYAFGQMADATFAGTAGGIGGGSGNTINAFGNSINLTTAWSVFASYEHFWTPSLRTSLYGSYLAVNYNDSAKGQFCANLANSVTGTSTGLGGLNCTPNWSSWDIGTRSQWNVTKDFYIGVDVIYSKFNSAQQGTDAAGGGIFFPATTGIGGAAGGHPSGVYTNYDPGVVSVTWRAHRDIVP
jgi:hypothetical protein